MSHRHLFEFEPGESAQGRKGEDFEGGTIEDKLESTGMCLHPLCQ